MSAMSCEQQPEGNILTFFASSDTERVDKIFDKMGEVRKKRAEREGKEPEIPSDIRASRINILNRTRIFTFTYHNREHSIERKGNLENFKGWIIKYSKTAESCITCDGLMLPGEAVGKCSEGLMHLTYNCCPTAAFFAGHIDEEGKLEQYRKSD